MQDYCFKKIINSELAKEYCQEAIDTCPCFKEGQEFIAGFEKPVGFCDWAWNDLLRFIRALLTSGNFSKDIFKGWMKNEKTMIACCTNGIRPVILKIERINDSYHLVLVVKYRRKVINDRVAVRIREIGEYIAPHYNITFLEYNHDHDHVYILFSAHPKSALSKYINAFKSASSRLVKKEFPEIKKYLWKEYFWSRSFCLLTTGEAPVEVIKKYIESQGEKNDHRSPVSH